MVEVPKEPASDVPYRPSFPRVLKQSVVALYDHLGLVVTTNLLWITAGGLALTAAYGTMRVVGPAGGLAAIPIALAGWAAANAGMWYVAHRVATRQDVAPADILIGVRTHFKASLGLVGIHTAGVILLASNVWFYGAKLAEEYDWSPAVAVFWLFVLAYFLTLMLYTYPFVMTQRVGAWAASKKSALVAADNPVFTLLLGLVAGAWGLLGAVPLWSRSMLPAGFAVLILATCYASAVALLASHALAALLKKYQD